MPKKRTELPPELVAEWADDRTIEEVLATPKKLGGSGVQAKVKWRCAKGHTWFAKINARIRDRVVLHRLGCAQCSGKAKLVELPAKFASEWADSRLISGVASHDKTATWKCPSGHLYQKSISDRIHRAQGCTTCGRKGPAVLPHNLAQDWADARSAASVMKADRTARWQCCSCQFVWCNSISKRLRGRGCPRCAGNMKRVELPPFLQAEWADSRPVVMVSNKDKTARWRCTAHKHIWTTSIGVRIAGHGCPHCTGVYHLTLGRRTYLSLSIRFREEAPDLLRHATTAAKGLAILAALGADKGELGKAYRNALALTQRGVSVAEAVRRVADDMDHDEAEDDANVKPKKTKKSTPDDVGLLSSKDLAELISDSTDPADAPAIWTKQRLDRALASNRNIAAAIQKQGKTLDEDTCYQFFIDAGLAELRDGYCDAEIVGDISPTDFLARLRAEIQSESKLSRTIAKRFIEEIEGAAALHVPRYFKPTKDGKPMTLRMMQRLIAWHMLRSDRFGNWSAPGAGKTIGALFAATMLESQLTIVLCPLQVVPTWQKEIDNAYASGKRVYRTYAAGTWAPPADTNFLLLHYDILQQKTVADDIAAFAKTHGSRVGFVVVDEVHRGKNDGSIGQGDVGKRHAGIVALTEALPKAKLLIQTGTPLQTKCAEAISLLKLIAPEVNNEYGFSGRSGLPEAIRIHWAMSRFGVRFRPRIRHEGRDLKRLAPTVELADKANPKPLTIGEFALNAPKASTNLAPIIRLDEKTSAPLIHTLRNNKRMSWLDTDEFLTKHKLAAIVAAARPGCVVYTEHVGVGRTTPIVKTIERALKKAGFSTAIFDGRAESVQGHDPRNANCGCTRCDGMRKFRAGKVDVLIASRTIGEGVDGLQSLGNRVIISSAPWHDAAWQQLLGRWYRSGQTQDVEVVVPIVVLQTNKHEISLDLLRLSRLSRSATLADCVLDGVIPTAQTQQSVLDAARQQLEGM